MKRFFYPRLAMTNIQKNRQIYFPYILTSSFTVMMLYLIHYLAYHKGIDQMASGTATIRTILMMGVWIVIIFSVIFLLYINSFMMKRRKKEIALYNVLGMEKKHVMIMMFFETLLTAVVSLALGFLFGIIFSQFMNLIFVRLLNVSTTITFGISWESIGLGVCIFIPIYFLTYVLNMIHIKLSNPIELLRGAQSGEKEPKTRFLMTLVGVITLGGGYYLAMTINDPTTAVVTFFLAVLLVIVGTYCLFTAGSVTLLKILKKNKHFYYQTKHFVSVSQLVYRMKQNAVGLASICILCTCILVMLSSTVSLYYGIEETARSYQDDSYHLKIYGYDNGELPSAEVLDRFYQQTQEQLEEHQIPLKSFIHTLRYTVSVSIQESNQQIMTHDEVQGSYRIGYLVGITQDEYNRAYQQNVHLKDQEVLLCSNFYQADDMIQIAHQSYRVNDCIDPPYLLDSSHEEATKIMILIMKDEESIKNMMSPFFDEESLYPTDNLSIVYQNQSQEEQAEDVIADCINQLTQDAHDPQKGTFSFYASSLYQIKSLLTETYGSLFFLGIFLGVLFLMAAILIMYYKQLAEGYEDQKRFEIMQKVGMNKKEMKQTIRSQVLIFFYLPLVAAIIHMVFAFHMIVTMFEFLVTSGIEVFIVCTVISIIVMAVIYAIVYLLTSRTYYKIVKSEIYS